MKSKRQGAQASKPNLAGAGDVSNSNSQVLGLSDYQKGEQHMKQIEKAEGGKRSDQNKMTEKQKREAIDTAFTSFSQACVHNPGKFQLVDLKISITCSISVVLEFAMAYFKRGKCYMMMHDYKRALYDFSAAILNETRALNKQPYGHIKQEGGNANFYMHGGQCNYYLGQYEESLAHYEIAINKNKDDAGLLGLIHYNKGLANASLMRYQEAITDQSEALKHLEQNKQYQAKF